MNDPTYVRRRRTYYYYEPWHMFLPIPVPWWGRVRERWFSVVRRVTRAAWEEEVGERDLALDIWRDRVRMLNQELDRLGAPDLISITTLEAEEE